MNLSGKVLQAVYEESSAVDQTTGGPADSSLFADITPQRADSVIFAQFLIPRADVELLSGSHSERTMSARIWNETDGVLVGSPTILGRVLKGTSSAWATSTGGIHGWGLYTVDSLAARRFRLQFQVGIAGLCRARLRGDRSPFSLLLQEIEALPGCAGG